MVARSIERQESDEGNGKDDISFEGISAPDDKTIVVNNLEVGGVLGSAYVNTVGGNADTLWVNGTTTFTRDLYLQNDNAVTLHGLISGSGTLVKRQQPLIEIDPS